MRSPICSTTARAKCSSSRPPGRSIQSSSTSSAKTQSLLRLVVDTTHFLFSFLIFFSREFLSRMLTAASRVAHPSAPDLLHIGRLLPGPDRDQPLALPDLEAR